MKKLFQILVFSIMIPLITGCGSDLNSLEDGHHRMKHEKAEPVLKTVRMSFGGDFISESDEPLLRAEDGETYVAVNVSRAEKIEGGSTKTERYAYGFFKGREDISIDLETGYVYTFKASIIIEDRDKVALENSKYQDPFLLNSGEAVALSDFLNNGKKVFIYHEKEIGNADRLIFSQLKSGAAHVDFSEGLVSNGENDGATVCRYPRVKRFYGEAMVDPSSIISDVEIPMIYKSFGLKIQVGTMPDNTYVSVSDVTTYEGPDPGDRKHLVFTKGLRIGKNADNMSSWEGIFSLNKLDEQSQKFRLKFVWHKASGTEENFYHDFTVYAKKQKVLTLNIQGDGGEPSETKSGNITFTLDETWDNWDDVEENDSDTVSNK